MSESDVIPEPKRSPSAATGMVIIGILALLVWGLVGIKLVLNFCGISGAYADAKDALKRFTESSVCGNTTLIVESVRQVAKLNVMRVATADLGTREARDGNGNVKASIRYQYAGQADLYVDLRSAIITPPSSNDDCCKVVLPGLKIASPLEVPVKRTGEVECGSGNACRDEFRESKKAFWGGAEYEEKLLRELPKFKAEAIRGDCRAPEIVAKAKKRAESIIRYMLSPLVEDVDRDISIVWTADIVN